MASKPNYSNKTSKWSTKKVNELLQYIEDEGVMPVDNPFWKRKVEWRKAGVEFELTDEEFKEMVKITDDILYYGENYAFVMTDKGNRLVKLRRYQSKALLQLKHYQRNVWMASRQVGKCVMYDTEIQIKNPKTNIITKMPIFELYYSKKIQTDGSKLLRLEYTLFKMLFFIKKKIFAL